jgi:antitoxin ParD1/3/4
MSALQKFDVTLTGEIAALVNEAVESGEYAAGGEVVIEALLEWNLRRGLSGQSLERLRDLWSEGVASGAGWFDSLDAIKVEARRRMTAELRGAGGWEPERRGAPATRGPRKI